MGTTAVEVQDVSKRFRLYHEKYTSLKEKVIHAGRVPYEDLWALRDVSFEVQEGETVGILGRNGSGKSTLLKCVCGVLQPTAGQVIVRGKLAGLLELGAGFQQELSGRENIYLNGSMLGLSKRDVDRMFDDIVEFAELGQFIDNQVKFYSSGMYVRLGFAVAVNVDPDVLVIDEVLAVGDERFQMKCMDRVKRFQKEGRTILFVSHSPDQVRAICDRAVVLADGAMIGVGPPGEAVRLFRERLADAGDVLGVEAPAPVAAAEQALEAAGGEPASAPGATGAGRTGSEPGHGHGADHRPVRFTAIDYSFDAQAERRYLLPGEAVTVRAAFEAAAPTPGAVFEVELRKGNDLLFKTDTEVLGQRYDLAPGPGTIEFRLDALPLFDGAYGIVVGVRTARGMSDWREPGVEIEVVNPGRAVGLVAIPVHAQLLGGDAADPQVADGGAAALPPSSPAPAPAVPLDEMPAL